ncbi:MAG: flagellar brake protein [Thermodesulfobacteriota bacterium]
MAEQTVDPEFFHSGVSVMLQVRDSPEGKYTTFFRGYKNKDYLILDHPVKEGKLAPIADDTPCIIRFIHEGNIIGFRSRVLGVIRTPYPLIFLRYPQSVEMSRLRKFDRYPVKIEVVCAPRKLNGLVDSYPRDNILNLSAGGCQIEAFEHFLRDQTIFLTVFLPEQGKINDLEAEVKRVDKKGDKFILGIAFADLLDPGYEKIRAFLHTLEAFRVRAGL